MCILKNRTLFKIFMRLINQKSFSSYNSDRVLNDCRYFGFQARFCGSVAFMFFNIAIATILFDNTPHHFCANVAHHRIEHDHRFCAFDIGNDQRLGFDPEQRRNFPSLWFAALQSDRPAWVGRVDGQCLAFGGQASSGRHDGTVFRQRTWLIVPRQSFGIVWIVAGAGQATILIAQTDVFVEKSAKNTNLYFLQKSMQKKSIHLRNAPNR